ncbi:DMT family transporter [Actinomadura scrupuli]|uniref:DMT family transporter n=1 Tax=Actinomadura scrupuli TaxID=559629 RepID=UPI003D99B9AA
MNASAGIGVPAPPALPARRAHAGRGAPYATVRGAVGAGTAMSLVGSLTAVSATIGAYPVFGGQALRYAVAAAILFAIGRRRAGSRERIPPGGRGLSRREAGLLVALAATGLAGFNVFLVEAVRHSGPATVGTVIATVPVVLALAGPLQQRRRPSPRIVAAALVVTCGAVLATGLGGGGLTGSLLALGALAGEAGFSLLAVPLLPRLGPVRVSAHAAAFAVPMLLVAGLVADGRGVVRLPTAAEAMALAYIAVVITVVAFFLWYDALGRLGADRAGLFAGVIPISAIVTTVVLGLGAPAPAELAGAVLVAAGVVIGLRPARGARTAERRARLGARPAERGPYPGGRSEPPRKQET